MKTFDQMFSGKITPASENYLIYIDGDEVRMDRDEGKCGICDNLTQFYSISMMGRYCSPKCLNEEWDRYYDASSTKRPPERTSDDLPGMPTE